MYFWVNCHFKALVVERCYKLAQLYRLQQPTDNTLTCTHGVFAYICMGLIFGPGHSDLMKPPLFITAALNRPRGLLGTHLAVKQKLPSSVEVKSEMV